MGSNTLTNVFALTLVVGGAIAGASPAPSHNHQQLHAMKRSVIIKTVEVPGPTVLPVEFVLDGKIVSKNEVCEGIEKGNFQWEDPNDGHSECSFSSAGTTKEPMETTTAVEVAPSQASVAVQQKQVIKATPTQSFQAPEPSIKQDSGKSLQLSTATSEALTQATSSDPVPFVPSSTAEPSSTETPSTETPSTETPSTETPSTETSSTENSSLLSGTMSDEQGLELEFPDGEIDCSTFPSEYGPIEVEWANLGGWSGIQYVTVEGDAVTHIVTAVPGGNGCIPGAMCSYACPPGYQKSQWPSTQGTTGQSVGGIQCNANGKLSLTNPDLSKTLCIKGTGATHVQNKLSSNAAICRTDYPGL